MPKSDTITQTVVKSSPRAASSNTVRNGSRINESRLLTTKEVARKLNASPQFIYGLIKSGVLVPIKVGRSYRFTDQQLYDYINSSSPNSSISTISRDSNLFAVDPGYSLNFERLIPLDADLSNTLLGEGYAINSFDAVTINGMLHLNYNQLPKEIAEAHTNYISLVLFNEVGKSLNISPRILHEVITAENSKIRTYSLRSGMYLNSEDVEKYLVTELSNYGPVRAHKSHSKGRGKPRSVTPIAHHDESLFLVTDKGPECVYLVNFSDVDWDIFSTHYNDFVPLNNNPDGSSEQMLLLNHDLAKDIPIVDYLITIDIISKCLVGPVILVSSYLRNSLKLFHVKHSRYVYYKLSDLNNTFRDLFNENSQALIHTKQANAIITYPSLEYLESLSLANGWQSPTMEYLKSTSNSKSRTLSSVSSTGS